MSRSRVTSEDLHLVLCVQSILVNFDFFFIFKSTMDDDCVHVFEGFSMRKSMTPQWMMTVDKLLLD